MTSKTIVLAFLVLLLAGLLAGCGATVRQTTYLAPQIIPVGPDSIERYLSDGSVSAWPINQAVKLVFPKEGTYRIWVMVDGQWQPLILHLDYKIANEPHIGVEPPFVMGTGAGVFSYFLHYGDYSSADPVAFIFVDDRAQPGEKFAGWIHYLEMPADRVSLEEP